jgi:hypothetical protein
VRRPTLGHHVAVGCGAKALALESRGSGFESWLRSQNRKIDISESQFLHMKSGVDSTISQRV